MKNLALLSTFVLAANAASVVNGASGLRFFYCIHAEHSCTETGATVPVVGGNALAVAKRALSAEDDFVGFVDAGETTLQFYREVEVERAERSPD